MQEQASKPGQSMVEIALILPFLLLLVFGIIDLGWYIYGYATIYQAARNGAEKAAALPPQIQRVMTPAGQPQLDRSDICVHAVLDATQQGAVMFSDLTNASNPNNTIAINYPLRDAQNKPVRALGQPVEIQIKYQLNPLTPFWRLITFGNQGVMTIQTTARRSLESLGENPTAVNYLACN